MLVVLLIVLLVLAALLFALQRWLRVRYDVHSFADLRDLLYGRIASYRPRSRIASPRRFSPPPEPWYRNRRLLGTLLIALALLAAIILVWRSPRLLRPLPPDDQFVVRIAPFNVAGQDERQGRLLAEQLVDVLRTQVAGPVDLQVLAEPVTTPEAAFETAQQGRIDVLIWGSAAEGATVTQPGLSPQLVWLPNGPIVPRTWPGYADRFALAPSYDLALQPLNGAVVLPLVINSIGHWSRGDVDRAGVAAETLLRDYVGQVRPELPNMILALGDWAIGVYEQAEQRARDTLAAGDRPEHWNNLGVILQDRGQPQPAEDAYRRAIAQAPAFAIPHANLARLLLDQGRAAEALPIIQTADQLAPGVTSFRATLGAAQRANGYLAAARETFGAIARNDGQNTAAQAELALLSLTDVATATGRLEWELERPPIRSAEELADARQRIEADLAVATQRRAAYLEEGNAYGVAGRIEMQRLAEQAAARIEAAQLARRYDLLLAKIEAGKVEAAQDRGAWARLWDGLRGRRTLLQQARADAVALRERLPARQYDLLYQEGRAAYHDGNLEAAQQAWNAAQELADAASTSEAAFRRPEARYGLGMLSLSAGNRDEARQRFAAALDADVRFFPAHQELAMLSEQDGRWAEAEAHYRWLAEQRPFDHVGPLGLARVLNAQNRPVEAEAVLIPLANAGNADALILLGSIYRSANRLDEAERVLARAFEIAPGRADLHEERAALALARNDLPTAEAELKQAIRLDEQRVSARITLGQLYAERLGQPAAAAEQLRQAAQARPDDPNAQRWLGEALLQTNRPREAADAFLRALEANPNDYAARHGLAQAYFQLERLDEAAQAEQQAIDASNGAFVPAWIGLGDILQRQNQFDQARERYNAALQRDPAATGAYLGLARIATAQGDSAAAIDFYRRGLAADPQDVRLLTALGDQLVQTGDTVGAIEVYEQAKQLAPNNPAVRAGLGRALWQAGQADQALAELDQALRIDADDAPTLLLVGDISQSLGRDEAALEAYERATRVRRDWYEPYYRRGTLLLEQGRTADAIRELEQSVRLNAEFPQGAYWLGRAYRAAGRLDDAERMFRRAVELFPAYYEARYFLAQALDALGRTAEARDVYQTIVNEAPPTDPWHTEAQQAIRE